MKIPFLNAESDNEEIKMVDVDKIKPNTYQPRKKFDTDSIKELADSINNYGVIQPLTVRPSGDNYELIAGERRLRASKFLGLNKVPVVIKHLSDRETAEISLVENLQRKDLDFIEEAVAYSRLLNEFDLTQKELAESLGKSQSTIANKLRVLNLPESVRSNINSSVSERHARALLRLSNERQQLDVLEKIKKNDLTVRETSKLIENILAGKNKKETNKNNIKTAVKDMRVFTNSLNSTIQEMEKAGLDVKVDKKEKNDYIEYNIRLPRR